MFGWMYKRMFSGHLSEKEDPRMSGYPVRAVIPDGAKLKSKHWKCQITLNQGKEGACTGFAVAQEAACEPHVVPRINNDIARSVYLEAKRIDRFAGEDYSGSTVTAAMKVGKQLGWYDEYRWATSVDDLALAIGHCGPAVLGIPMYRGMFKPDMYGYIGVGRGKQQGGHAILCNGYDKFMNAFTLHNSWGPKWGRRNGECFIHYDEMVKLFDRGGRACIPIVRKG
jgi:hypothetical protein